MLGFHRPYEKIMAGNRRGGRDQRQAQTEE